MYAVLLDGVAIAAGLGGMTGIISMVVIGLKIEMKTGERSVSNVLAAMAAGAMISIPLGTIASWGLHQLHLLPFR